VCVNLPTLRLFPVPLGDQCSLSKTASSLLCRKAYLCAVLVRMLCFRMRQAFRPAGAATCMQSTSAQQQESCAPWASVTVWHKACGQSASCAAEHSQVCLTTPFNPSTQKARALPIAMLRSWACCVEAAPDSAPICGVARSDVSPSLLPLQGHAGQPQQATLKDCVLKLHSGP
jgi:hypothetical protein